MGEEFETTEHGTEKQEITKRFCNQCGYEFQEGEFECPKCGGKKVYKEEDSAIKNFVLSIGRFIVDFDTALGLFFAFLIFIFLILAVFWSFLPSDNGLYDNASLAPWVFVLAFIIPIIIIIQIVIVKYLIYVFIDIRDSLKELTRK